MTLIEIIIYIVIVIIIINLFIFSMKIDKIKSEKEKDQQDLDNAIRQLQILKKDSRLIRKELINNKEELQKLHNDNIELTKKIENVLYIKEDSKKLNAEIIDSEKSLIVKPEKNQQNTNKCKFDKEQQIAFEKMNNTTNNFFITGKAGTGKSYLLNTFVDLTNKITLKIAPTGIAALNINGTTIHVAFGYYNLEELGLEDINESSIRLKTQQKIVLRELETLIIDEISMVRADTFEKIDKILQIVNNDSRPFGGKQIIVFGDLFQLQPIAKPVEREYLNKKYGGVYFFQTPSYIKNSFEVIELNINHRQKDDKYFFKILNEIREGRLSQEYLNKLNERVVKNNENLRRIIRIYPTKSQANKVNQKELKKIPAKSHNFEAKILLNLYKNQNINIEDNFRIQSNLELKVGALVMMIANDVDKRWVNGTLGIISHIDKDVIKVTINGNEYQIHKQMFEKTEPKILEGKMIYEKKLVVEQYPVILSYAITIHKSQGMTYPQIVCDVTDSFTTGQTYVALSRCTSLKGLYLINEVTSSTIKVDSVVSHFYNNIKSNTRN